MIRSGAEIGAGLAPAREARPIRAGERVHVVGAAGAGASAAALLAHRAGAVVSGCDPGGPSVYTAALQAAGIRLDWAHGAEHVTSGGAALADRLAVTKALTSIDPDHPELAAARWLGIPVEPWQQVVADVAATTRQRLVAVAGTHGKSTTSGWLVHVLVAAGRDPSAFVGALLDPGITGGVPSTARWGSGDAFVVEADEYAGNFDPYRPSLTLLLNAEWDHPDVFLDAEAVVATFVRWILAAVASIPAAVVVPNLDDDGVAVVVDGLGAGPRVLGYGLTDQVRAGRWSDGAVHGRAGEGPGTVTTLDIPALDGWPGAVPLLLAGAHNASNALGVVAAALELGVPVAEIARGVGTFRGVGRRMEVKGEPAGVTVIDDYAHHPTAIEATLAAVRMRYPGRRVWAVYEPLTYHRTARMLDRFAEVLATADRAVIADIWAGRDPDTSITSASALADAISTLAAEPAAAPGSVELTAEHLAERVEPGDVVLVMGGGRSYVIAERLVDALSGPAAERGGRG